MKIEFKYLVLCLAAVSGIKNGKEQGSVQDFIGNFTSLLNEGNAYLANFPSSREKNLNDDYLNTIKQHFSNLQQNGGSPLRPNNYPPGSGLSGPQLPLGPDSGRPFPGPVRPPFGSQGPSPPPGPGYPDQGGFPPGEGYPQGGGFLQGGGYPQGGGFPQGGGYPQGGGFPQGGGYPPGSGNGFPQGGGFPPGPGGGFPQGGGFPPGPGGGFPQGGGFPPGGGYPPGPGGGFPPLGPGGRPYPPAYRPPFGSYGYPPNSFIGALESISRYDDLRCVPRLLCEVTASRRPDGYPKEPGQLPFVSREVLITLLTVLNFVDDSPLLSFARAALLGYSSRGDLRSCITAYPTCPRDPDQLVNYLNNHNGGFFRFFNQQLYQQPQYVPQYLQLTDANKSIQPKQDDTVNTNSKIYKVKTVNYQPTSGFTSRILNNPINIEEIATTTTPTYPTRYPKTDSFAPGYTRRHPKTVLFQDESATSSSSSSAAAESDNFILPVRTGKRFLFPDRADKSIKSTGMIFPDRTGTGNLILSSDSQGNYKVVFAPESINNNNRKGKVKFLLDSDRMMKFPEDE